MPADNLRSFMDGRRERLRWIEFSDYAHRVFAAGNERWLTEASVHAGGLAQAQGVIGTEVLSIDILAPYFAVLEPAPDAPADAAQAMLGQAAPAAFTGEVLDALLHGQGGKVDLVLKVPAPADILRAAGLAGDPAFDDLDDIAIALADVLRAHAGRALSGVLITTSAPFSDDETEALETVVGTAKHYDWCVAISFDKATEPLAGDPPIGADLVVYPACDFAALAALENVGGGLVPAFWAGEPVLPDAARMLAYGIVPPGAAPETVLACATQLKQA